jgi:hypothetical protein
MDGLSKEKRMKVKVTWLHTDGTRLIEHRFHNPDSDESFSDVVGYEALTKFVGGPIEYVALADDRMFYCHEEGKIEGLPFNAAATALFQAAHGYVDPVAGNVVVCEAVR